MFLGNSTVSQNAFVEVLRESFQDFQGDDYELVGPAAEFEGP